MDARELGPDPGDRALLERAVSENRILITMDKDFGELIHLHGRPHTGLIRLPEVRMAQSVNGGVKVGRVGGRLLSIGDLILYRLPSFIGL